MLAYNITSRGGWDTLITGAPLGVARRLDLRLALQADGTISMPNGIFGLLLNELRKSLDGETDVAAAASAVARDLYVAARVCEHFSHQMAQLHRITATDVQVAANAAGLSAFYAPSDAVAGDTALKMAANRLFDYISLAQTNDRIVSRYERVQRSALPFVTAMWSGLDLPSSSTLEDDLNHLADLIPNEMALAFITRIPTISATFSSNATVMDWNVRQQTLLRLAAYFAVISVSREFTKLLVIHTLLRSPLFERDFVTTYHSGGLDRLNREYAYLRSVVGEALVSEFTATFETSATHCGTKVRAFVLPQGFYHEYLLSPRNNGLMEPVAYADLDITPFGVYSNGTIFGSMDVDADTTADPTLNVFSATTGNLDAQLSVMFNRLHTFVMQNTPHTLAPHLLAILKPGAASLPTEVSTACGHLALTSSVARPLGYASGEDVIPDLTDGVLGSRPMRTAVDLLQGRHIPNARGRYDYRQIARFVVGRACRIRDRVAQGLESQAALAIPTRMPIDPTWVMLPVSVSPMFQEWPRIRLTMDLWELQSAAFYTGQALRAPKTPEGLTQVLGLTPNELSERVVANSLATASGSLAGVDVMAQALARTGALLYFESGSSLDLGGFTRAVATVLNDPNSDLKRLTDLFANAGAQWRVFNSSLLEWFGSLALEWAELREFLSGMLFGSITYSTSAPGATTTDAGGIKVVNGDLSYAASPFWLDSKRPGGPRMAFWPWAYTPTPPALHKPMLDSNAMNLIVDADAAAVEPNRRLLQYRPSFAAHTWPLWPVPDIVRTINTDARSYVWVSWPVGIAWGSEVSLLARSYGEGGTKRHRAERFDVADAIIVTEPQRATITSAVLLQGRSGAQTYNLGADERVLDVGLSVQPPTAL